MNKLRIFVIGNQGHAHALLQHLFKAEDCEIIGLCTKKPSKPSLSLRTRSLISRTLSYFDIRQPQDDFYKNPFDDFGDILKFSNKHNIPIFYSSRLDKSKFVDELTKLDVDLILCCGFHRLVPARIFTLPKVASINFHTGCLPRRGGGTPVRWAIYHGDNTVCYSAHIMTEKYDEGLVVAKRNVMISNTDNYGDVERKMHNILPSLTEDILNLARKRKLSKFGKAPEQPNIEPPFRGKYQYVDWSCDGIYISRICQAIKPKSGAIAFFKGRKITFWSVDLVPNPTSELNLRYGEVYDKDELGNPIVYAPNRSVCIREYLDGRKIRKGKTLKKRGVVIGSCFDT